MADIIVLNVKLQVYGRRKILLLINYQDEEIVQSQINSLWHLYDACVELRLHISIDKICAEFALKGVTSHVIDEGLEPYSEYRPEEEISTLVAPLAVAARKTPSIFLAMFTNKLIIEAKRQLRKIYLEEDE